MASVWQYEKEIWAELRNQMNRSEVADVFPDVEESLLVDGELMRVDLVTGAATPLREIDLTRRTKAMETVRASLAKRAKV